MKKWVFFLIVLTVFFLTVPPGLAATTSPSLSGVQIYPSDDVWNVRVDTLSVDAKSSAYVNSAGSAHMYMWDDFPINVVDGTTAKQYLKSITYPQYSDNIAYPIPSNPLIQSQSDRHLLIVDKSTNYLYEMYHASKNSDGTYSASVAVSYDLSSYALRNAPSVSADAAGLPMLPGLVRYDEIASGSINHALRFATNELRNTYIWPARGAAGSSDSDSSLPPHGQRFRLKASFDTSKYPAQERIVLEALKKYGMILADWNGGDSSTFHICAVPDSRVTINWDSFSAIHMTDFEAVDESSLMINKDSGQARTTSTTITPTPTPTPIPTVTPTSTPTPVPTSTPTPTPTVSTPKITVTSPNGGESWSAGSTRRITWTSSGSVGSSMKIELMKGSAVVQTILSSTENDGSYSSWTISSGLQGTDYRIRISSTSNPAIADTSNSVFTITGASAVVSNQQEIGIFSVGLWYVDNNGTGIFSTNDKTTSFGITGDIPVSGDWNVDGRTEIGVFRPSTHMFYLDYNGNGVWSGAVTDRSYNFGITGDIPVSGDWNVDGRTEIGVFRPSTNMFYLDYNGNGVWNGAMTDITYNFGTNGGTPVSGKWS